MIKQAPSRGRLALMAAFALSCFALLLFLWTSFGGPVPLKAKGYRYQADFSEATQLADNAEVRISGVPVGRVVSSRAHEGRTRAEIEIDAKYAPVPRDTQAILRVKTLLGETYVEVTPGSKRAGMLPDGGLLHAGRVRETVELDEVLRALDARTRRQLQKLLRGMAGALEDRGPDINAAVANFDPFSEDATGVLRVLDRQSRAVRTLVRESGTVLSAASSREGALRSLVESGDRILAVTARREARLAEAVRILPTTLRELRPTMDEVAATARAAAPVVRDLRPGARVLAPALRNPARLAPELRATLAGVDRVARAAEAGLPAATRIVEAVHPVFGTLDVTLREALPVVQYLGLFKQDLITSFSNLASASQGQQAIKGGGDPLKVLRVVVPFLAEGLVAYDRRIPSNRHNPYFGPEPLRKLATGLESWDCSHTGNPGPSEEAPPCRLQEPLEFQGRRNAFPHVLAEP